VTEAATRRVNGGMDDTFRIGHGHEVVDRGAR
jgi:hypothetical protein